MLEAHGQTVYVSGYRTLREQSRELVIRLRASENSQPVAVVWVNPDDSFIPIPITK